MFEPTSISPFTVGIHDIDTVFSNDTDPLGFFNSDGVGPFTTTESDEANRLSSVNASLSLQVRSWVAKQLFDDCDNATADVTADPEHDAVSCLTTGVTEAVGLLVVNTLLIELIVLETKSESFSCLICELQRCLAMSTWRLISPASHCNVIIIIHILKLIYTFINTYKYVGENIFSPTFN